MQIKYKNNRIEKICTNAYEAERKYGKMMAEKIQLRVDQIEAAVSVDMMVQYKIGRCHRLKGARREQYAVDLVHPYRLVFILKDNEVQVVKIMEIVDYH